MNKETVDFLIFIAIITVPLLTALLISSIYNLRTTISGYLQAFYSDKNKKDNYAFIKIALCHNKFIVGFKRYRMMQEAVINYEFEL